MDNQTMDSNNDWRNPEELVANDNDWVRPDEPAAENNDDWVNPDGKPKKQRLLTKYSYILSIITAIICGVPAVGVALGTMLWGSISGMWLIAYAIFGAVTTLYAPFMIPIALSAILTIVFYCKDTKKVSESDDLAQFKIVRRTLVSAALLLTPAIIFSVISMISPFDTLSSDFDYRFLEIGAVAIVIMDIAIFVALRIPRVKDIIRNFELSLRGLAALVIAIELILCGGWGFSVARHFFEINREERMEREESEQSLKSLRNPTIDDELSDLVALRSKQTPYRIIYSDSKTGGIFAYDLGNNVSELFYAAYYGKDEDDKNKVSLVELGTIYSAKDYARSDSIGETKYDYTIYFVNASDDESALERARKRVDDADSSRGFSIQERQYVFYADGFDNPTDKDFLNAILSSNLYIRDSSAEQCGDLIWGYREGFKCIEADGNLLQRYLNDESNYSSYSIEALYKNRHVYFAPTKDNFSKRLGHTSRVKSEYNIFWQEPFTQGKLTFKYLPSYIFEQHDGNLDWEDENTTY